MSMDWSLFGLVAILVAVYLLVKRAGQISPRKATLFLLSGAVVVDVRSATEFGIRHLPRAINVPLSELEELLPRRVKNKDMVILLHCQTGARSGAAKKKAGSMGYTHVFNLGSYNRAAKIVGNR
jgi:phage shock protein E